MVALHQDQVKFNGYDLIITIHLIKGDMTSHEHQVLIRGHLGGYAQNHSIYTLSPTK